jgi:hypothetical protein
MEGHVCDLANAAKLAMSVFDNEDLFLFAGRASMVFTALARKRAFCALILAAFLALGAFRVSAAFFALRTGVASQLANQSESEPLRCRRECEHQPDDFAPLLLHGRAAVLLV